MRARPLLFACTIALCAPAASAQPTPGAATPLVATDEADRLFREANKLYNEKKYGDAEAVYERAFAQKQAHDIAANLGYAELKQNKLVEAAEHIAFAVRTWPPTGKEENRRSAEEQLGKLKAELVTVTFEVNVPDAQLLVNDRDLGAPARATEGFALPGRVSVRARRVGYVDAEAVIEAAAKGSAHAVRLVMKPAPPAVPTPTASVTATATALPTSVRPPSSHPRLEVVVGGAALSGAALVVGGVLVGMAEKTRADLRAEAPRNPDGSFVCAAQTAPGTALPICDDLRARARDASSFGQAGIGLLVGGGLVGLLTAGYALFWPRSQQPAATTVTPVVTRTHAGLVWSGSF